MGPPDAILGIAENFRACTAPGKVNVAIGAYRDETGVPWVLPSVQAAEAKLLAASGTTSNKEYLPITGDAEYVSSAVRFAMGECEALSEGRVAAVQTLSGTGACRVAAEFFTKFLGQGHPIYVSDPTWGNHIPIMGNAGLEVRRYRYFDKATNGLDFTGMMEDVQSAPEGSIFLLHACAHNPTGVDPTQNQWAEISQAMKDRKHHVFFDSAYQGFASGDAEKDAYAIRSFLEDGHLITLAQSFAKNFGLYGERVGALSMVCQDAETAGRVLSQLKLVIRPMYSSPPIHGAAIVREILKDEGLSSDWRGECSEMAARIGRMRTELRRELAAAGSELDWSHITDQIGMFAFTGLSPEACARMTDKHNIYLTKDGRISLAGINDGNCAYVAAAMHDCTTMES
eukprot:CAMPEP_0185773304 /NCGR_PEP_ID=MMETSP1174-20130828/72888_1 /TAXON_ID=35687 /ORGANISM="Dictyocha speculum, Strain CCMP1381" /LENGTH=398 /DNA_ID=CAMNT_0028459927 /DNA_START=184 /DNA_END=1380 /DNA_ORIENTATION=-